MEIEKLSSKIKTIELEQNNKIDILSHKIDKLYIQLDARIDNLEEKFKDLDSRISTKFNLLVGMFFAQFAAIVAILVVMIK